MSLTALLEAGPPQRPKPKDKVLASIEHLDQEQREAFHQIVLNPGFSSTAIAAALTNMDVPTTGRQVRNLREKIKEGQVKLESD